MNESEDLKKVEKPEILGDILKSEWSKGGEENEKSSKQHILLS